MRCFVFLSPLFFITQLSSQVVCSGRKAIVTEDGECAVKNLQLVFEDNFDSDTLDTSKWYYTQPWGNHSLDGFNASLEYQTDGLNYDFTGNTVKLLVKDEKIYAKAVTYMDSDYVLRDNLPNLRWWDYTAGMVYSKENFGYGKYEMRCKMPKGKGFWSVFWLYGMNGEEIDVFEFWNEENLFGVYKEKKLSTEGNMTTHGNDKMCLTHYTGEDFSLDFHVFSLIWDNNKIQWFVDGNLKRTSYKFYSLLGQGLECDDIKKGNMYLIDKTYPLNRLHISVSLGIQKGKNAPDKSTPFPSAIEVDYIRFWEYK